MQKFARVLVSLCCLLFAVTATATDPLAAKRARFHDLYKRILAGQAVDMDRASAELAGYPLLPYLDYARLRRLGAAADLHAVERFLDSHGQLPVAGLLRQDLLGDFGAAGRWDGFRRLYAEGGGAELRCYELLARRRSAPVDAAWLTAARELWLSGRSQPRGCDPVFEVLYGSGRLTEDDVWVRVGMAMELGEHDLARYLGRRLGAERQVWLEHWLRVARNPAATLARPTFLLQGEEARQLVSFGLRRLTRAEPEQALSLLAAMPEVLFEPLHRAELQRDLALWGAYSQNPKSLAWLEGLAPEVVTDEVRLWIARMALRSQNWPRLLAAIDALPPQWRDDTQWRYWRAHALELTGQLPLARDLLAGVAAERNYYGFLAADRLNRPYNLNYVPTRFARDEITSLHQQAGVVRAREFFLLGFMPEARREWLAAMAQLSPEDQARAAVLALEWGWYDRAVATANQAGLDDALDLRFPTPFRPQLERHSKEHGLSLPVTYAVVRRESAFRPDAISPAGAMGLMQVMPQTGRLVARDLRERAPSRSAMLEVDTNLRLGSAYLRGLLDRYGGNLVLAAAAYNAGPHRVADWLDRNGDLPPELWIEAISFQETREYVKAILAYTAVFDWQLNGESRRLADYLQPMRPVACTGDSQGTC